MAIEVRCIEHLSSEQRQSLNLLYGPLMGKNSICLYEFLGSIQNLVELEDVYLLLNMNASQFDIARNRLEQYHLIETYVHEGDMLIYYMLHYCQIRFYVMRHIQDCIWQVLAQSVLTK